MRMTFLPDLLIALITASFTVLFAFVTYRLSVRRDETRAISALIAELHGRRAFAGDAVVIAEGRNAVDFHRANSSVLSVKDEVRRLRDSVPQLS
jgi:hypothetical protein